MTSKFKNLNAILILGIIAVLACRTPKPPATAKAPPVKPVVVGVKDTTGKKITSFSANSVYTKKPHRSEPAPKDDYTRPGYNSAAPVGPHIQKATSKP